LTDLRFSPEEETFREETRSFLRAKLPARISEKVRTGKRLTRQGRIWRNGTPSFRSAGGWQPIGQRNMGRAGWTVAQAAILDVETAVAYAHMSVKHLQPFADHLNFEVTKMVTPKGVQRSFL
jgi:hypothetical protein